VIERQRIAVIGASSGLGRTIGIGLAHRGARVAFLARRADRIAEAAGAAGNDARAVVCDVTDESSCQAAIEDVATTWGGLDGLVYSAGAIAVAPLENVDAATWAHLFATNVTGAALTTAAALPYLLASRGVAVFLSSISASLTPPWPKIGSYVTTKAALDKLVEAWRVEHPRVRFTRLAVGDCAGGDGDSGSEFISHVEPAIATDAIGEWLRLGYMTGNLIESESLVDAVDAVLRCPSAIPTLTLAPSTT
jgi:NAD(P)-dependent dehydrogenase (short-subunit alcohol dehydrogenase family)